MNRNLMQTEDKRPVVNICRIQRTVASCEEKQQMAQ